MGNEIHNSVRRDCHIMERKVIIGQIFSEEGNMYKKYDLAIIGGGPGGYVAAIRGAQMKKRVVLIESQKLGGTCINRGCIPAKYLLHQTKMVKEIKENRNIEGPLEKIRCNWKKTQDQKAKIIDRLVNGIEFLLKKNGVEFLPGKGFVKNRNQITVKTEEGREVIEVNKIILATGSRPGDLPFLLPNGREVITSREALDFPEIPKKLLIIGAGAVGLEMGTIYQRMGTEVIILEIMPTVLPGSDGEMVRRLERILEAQGLQVLTQMNIKSYQIKEGRVRIKGTCLKTNSSFEYEADKMLLAVGRNPNSEGLIASDLKLSLDKKGFVEVNNYLETGLSGIYAIGDLIGGKLMAHKASHEGIIAAENSSGAKRMMDYQALPTAVYTEPEFSSVGLTEEEAREKEIKVQVGVFSLRANGRALTLEKQEGMIKVIADKKDKVIGAHIIAPYASEFISELSLAISKGLRVQDISSSIHIHPTLSEAVMESAMKVKKEAIHMLNV